MSKVLAAVKRSKARREGTTLPKTGLILGPLVEHLQCDVEYGPAVHTRASASADYCPRHHYFDELYGDGKKRLPPDPNLAATFAYGHGIHGILQDEWLGVAGVLYGGWGCLRCGLRHGDPRQPSAWETKPPWSGEESCPASELWGFPIHHEWRFIEPEYQAEVGGLVVTGHSDGGLRRESGKRVIAEFKSISKRGFDALKKPPDNYIEQINTYMWLTQQSANPDDHIDEAVLLFVSKGWHRTAEFEDLTREAVRAALSRRVRGIPGVDGISYGPFKEFFVRYDAAKARKYRLKIEAAAEALANIEKESELIGPPDRLRECDSPLAARAKKCAVCDLCFGYDDLKD